MTVRTERGFVLLVELWTLAFLALLTTQLVTAARNEAEVAFNLRRNAVQEWNADGAVNTTAWHLLDRAGQRWNADGVLHRLRMAGSVVDLRISDEANKINLNTASVDLLRALLLNLGVTKDAASELAQAIADWREAGNDPPGVQAARYRAAGLDYAPPEKPFRSVDELRWVVGMTPRLLALIRPHVTIYSAYGPERTTTDPIVRAAIMMLRTGGGVLPLEHAGDGVTVVDITAAATGADGAAFTRHAVLRLDAGATGRGCAVLVWERDPTSAGTASSRY